MGPAVARRRENSNPATLQAPEAAQLHPTQSRPTRSPMFATGALKLLALRMEATNLPSRLALCQRYGSYSVMAGSGLRQPDVS